MTEQSTGVTGSRVRAPDGPAQADAGRRWLPLIAWLGGLVVGTVLFHALGSGPLAAPPRDPAGWSAWLAERDAIVAAVALLRLVVLALSWYLVGATTIGIAARLAPAARLVRAADALTVPFVRRLLQTTLGVTLATTMAVSAMPSGSVQPSSNASSVTLSASSIDGPAEAADGAEVELRAVAAGEEDATGGEGDGVTLERLEPADRPLPLELLERAREQAPMPEADAADTDTGPDVGADTATDRSATVAGGAEARSDEYVVTAGDSLWSIAETALVADGEHSLDDEAVATYWLLVVEANRDALADPQNPDLIFPGQVVRLPPLPA